MRSCPSVSVVICAYNYERFVAESVDSALGQEYPANRLEIIVVDDGSTDATPDILAGYERRVRVVRQQNAGLIAATTRGIEESSGDLIAILDADDAWRPDKLRRQVALLDARPELGLVYSDKEMVDEHGRRIAPSFLANGGIARPPKTDQVAHLLAYNFVPAPTILFRREHVDRILPFSPAATAQDWWIALRVAQVAPVDHVPLPLVRYRVHGSNMGIGSRGEKLRKLLGGFLGFQRWNLLHLDLSMVAASGLHAAWQRYLLNAGQLAQVAGERLEDVLLVDRDTEVAATEVTRAVEAFGDGDAPTAFRHLLAARVADPFEADVRSAYEDVVAELLDAEEVERRRARAAVVGTHVDPLRGRLAWARRLLDEGSPARAAQELLALEKETAGTPEVSAALAVAAGDADHPVIAARAGRDALRAGSEDPALLRALAKAARGADDTRAAAHWARSATEAAPGDAEAWREVGFAALAQARWSQAVEALERAAARAPLPVDAEPRLEEARATAARETAATPAEPARDAGSVLICADRFGARADRLGRFAEDVAIALKSRGWRVEVAARAPGDATARARRGMRVHTVRERSPEAFARVLARGRFDAVLVLGDPASWSLRQMLAVARRPRTIVVPDITDANESVVRDSPQGLRAFRELVCGGHAVVRRTRSGTDARLLADLAVAAVDVPHVVPSEAPAGSLRRRLDLSDAPLVFAPEPPETDPDLAAIQAVADAPGDWNLVVAAPSERPVAEGLAGLAARDARITVAQRLTGPLVAAGIREAEVVLAPAHGGGEPGAVLAAMAAGLPWLAAPGAAVDGCCGGITAAAPATGEAVQYLLADPDVCERLGAAGAADAAGRSVDAAAARLDALLRGAETLPPALPPDDAVAATEAAQAGFLRWYTSGPLRSSAAAAIR